MIGLLLLGTAQAEELVPHERVLLRGDVPLRLATDSSPVCALELRVSDGGALVDAWRSELGGRFGDAGLRVEADRGADSIRLSAPAPAFPALIEALGELVGGSAAAATWRGLALVCPGEQAPWIARMDAAFGRASALRRTLPPDAPEPPTEPLTVVRGAPLLAFSWSTDELSQVEAQLALELRRAALVQALEEEEIAAEVEVDTAFSRARRRASLRLVFDARQPLRPLLDLVRGVLVEQEEAPMARDVLDARWRAQRVAILRGVDSPTNRARALADREDWGADPSRDLDAARSRSPLAFHRRSRSLALSRAALVVQHPDPPRPNELRPAPEGPRARRLEPSFDDEDE